MNWLYNRFDAHKWIIFSRTDYLSDDEDFTMIIFNDYESPKVSSSTQQIRTSSVNNLIDWILVQFLLLPSMFNSVEEVWMSPVSPVFHIVVKVSIGP